MRQINISNKIIGDNEPSFVIAEVAGSHEGNLDTAKKTLKAAYEAGADAIKYQVFRADELVVAHHPKYTSFKKVEFQPQEWLELLDYSKNFDILFLADVFDMPSLELMSRSGVEGYKIHLSHITNPHFLREVAKRGKPLFLAVGGAFPEEIEKAIYEIKQSGNENIILMHGYQGYPTKIEETNFRRLLTLKRKFNLAVGFLDHMDANSPMRLIIPLISYALGAKFIEKHITLDRSLKGTDYYSSLEPDEFKTFVQYLSEVAKALGSEDLAPTQEEIKYREEVIKHIVAAVPIPKGSTISSSMLSFKRTVSPGLSPASITYVEGKVTKEDIEKDELVTMSKLE